MFLFYQDAIFSITVPVNALACRYCYKNIKKRFVRGEFYNNQFRSSGLVSVRQAVSLVQTAIILDDILVTSADIYRCGTRRRANFVKIYDPSSALLSREISFILRRSRPANSRCAGKARVCVATFALRLQSV